jgi:anthranilate phosphoribosyltransferase
VPSAEALGKAMAEAFSRAAAALDSGAAADLLDRWVARSQELAGRSG